MYNNFCVIDQESVTSYHMRVSLPDLTYQTLEQQELISQFLRREDLACSQKSSLQRTQTAACLLAGSSRGRGRARSLSYFYNLTITSSKPNISQTPHLQIPSCGRYDSNI